MRVQSTHLGLAALGALCCLAAGCAGQKWASEYEPHGTLIGILCYFLRSEDLGLVRRYLDEGNDSDKAGSFIQWRISVEEVVGFPFTGDWIDIGTKVELERAEKLWAGK